MGKNKKNKKKYKTKGAANKIKTVENSSNSMSEVENDSQKSTNDVNISIDNTLAGIQSSEILTEENEDRHSHGSTEDIQSEEIISELNLIDQEIKEMFDSMDRCLSRQLDSLFMMYSKKGMLSRENERKLISLYIKISDLPDYRNLEAFRILAKYSAIELELNILKNHVLLERETSKSSNEEEIPKKDQSMDEIKHLNYQDDEYKHFPPETAELNERQNEKLSVDEKEQENSIITYSDNTKSSVHSTQNIKDSKEETKYSSINSIETDDILSEEQSSCSLESNDVDKRVKIIDNFDKKVEIITGELFLDKMVKTYAINKSISADVIQHGLKELFKSRKLQLKNYANKHLGEKTALTILNRKVDDVSLEAAASMSKTVKDQDTGDKLPIKFKKTFSGINKLKSLISFHNELEEFMKSENLKLLNYAKNSRDEKKALEIENGKWDIPLEMSIDKTKAVTDEVRSEKLFYENWKKNIYNRTIVKINYVFHCDISNEKVFELDKNLRR